MEDPEPEPCCAAPAPAPALAPAPAPSCLVSGFPPNGRWMLPLESSTQITLSMAGIEWSASEAAALDAEPTLPGVGSTQPPAARAAGPEWAPPPTRQQQQQQQQGDCVPSAFDAPPPPPPLPFHVEYGSTILGGAGSRPAAEAGFGGPFARQHPVEGAKHAGSSPPGTWEADARPYLFGSAHQQQQHQEASPFVPTSVSHGGRLVGGDRHCDPAPLAYAPHASPGVGLGGPLAPLAPPFAVHGFQCAPMMASVYPSGNPPSLHALVQNVASGHGVQACGVSVPWQAVGGMPTPLAIHANSSPGAAAGPVSVGMMPSDRLATGNAEASLVFGPTSVLPPTAAPPTALATAANREEPSRSAAVAAATEPSQPAPSARSDPEARRAHRRERMRVAQANYRARVRERKRAEAMAENTTKLALEAARTEHRALVEQLDLLERMLHHRDGLVAALEAAAEVERAAGGCAADELICLEGKSRSRGALGSGTTKSGVELRDGTSSAVLDREADSHVLSSRRSEPSHPLGALLAEREAGGGAPRIAQTAGPPSRDPTRPFSASVDAFGGLVGRRRSTQAAQILSSGRPLFLSDLFHAARVLDLPEVTGMRPSQLGRLDVFWFMLNERDIPEHIPIDEELAQADVDFLSELYHRLVLDLTEVCVHDPSTTAADSPQPSFGLHGFRVPSPDSRPPVFPAPSSPHAAPSVTTFPPNDLAQVTGELCSPEEMASHLERVRSAVREGRWSEHPEDGIGGVFGLEDARNLGVSRSDSEPQREFYSGLDASSRRGSGCMHAVPSKPGKCTSSRCSVQMPASTASREDFASDAKGAAAAVEGDAKCAAASVEGDAKCAAAAVEGDAKCAGVALDKGNRDSSPKTPSESVPEDRAAPRRAPPSQAGSATSSVDASSSSESKRSDGTSTDSSLRAPARVQTPCRWHSVTSAPHSAAGLVPSVCCRASDPSSSSGSGGPSGEVPAGPWAWGTNSVGDYEHDLTGSSMMLMTLVDESDPARIAAMRNRLFKLTYYWRRQAARPRAAHARIVQLYRTLVARRPNDIRRAFQGPEAEAERASRDEAHWRRVVDGIGLRREQREGMRAIWRRASRALEDVMRRRRALVGSIISLYGSHPSTDVRSLAWRASRAMPLILRCRDTLADERAVWMHMNALMYQLLDPRQVIVFTLLCWPANADLGRLLEFAANEDLEGGLCS